MSARLCDCLPLRTNRILELTSGPNRVRPLERLAAAEVLRNFGWTDGMQVIVRQTKQNRRPHVELISFGASISRPVEGCC